MEGYKQVSTWDTDDVISWIKGRELIIMMVSELAMDKLYSLTHHMCLVYNLLNY